MLCLTLTYSQNHPKLRRSGARSAGLLKRPANLAVALREVLGSRNVEILATQALSTRGCRESRLAQVKVSLRQIDGYS